MHEGHRQRLKKTYLEHGAPAFHDHQLLELLLTFAIPRRDTNALAHSLLSAYGSLDKVLAANPYDLMRQEGVGQHAAVLLSLAGALAKRGGVPQGGGRVRLSTADAASRYCRALFYGARYEEAYVISLDARENVLHVDRVASGTVGETPVYPRLVVECALRHGASSIILTHNHPSGDPRPSQTDIDMTGRMRAALDTVDVQLHDHIITGDGRTYSMLRNLMLHSGAAREGRGQEGV